MRILSVVLVVWLLIGVLASAQRGYFDSDKDPDVSCSDAGTIAVSIVAGPLNYLGANPKVDCKVPQPSK
ncbi:MULTISPECIES: hypothetical protein [Kineosporia]|uniref:Uncharacterized protein n=1 Tax=Kineosporia mesophila TaxID=566012 RepID=A0ABP6ZI30_9ACTN|nr:MULTISPECIES: hypothetical protein [Kineosporia]MCD5350584.1 hypothetical protein [Kineosporia mesophila]GLY26918.1 hypothetical protein Kisp02_02830 [Kineosporia sp. NBRC 101731]